MEEFFWLLRFPGPYRYTCGAVVEGFTQPGRWGEAWDAIRPFFGVLRASIRKQPGSRPAFVRADLFIPACVRVWEPGLDLDSIMAADLNDGSEDWDAALVQHGKELRRLTLK